MNFTPNYGNGGRGAMNCCPYQCELPHLGVKVHQGSALVYPPCRNHVDYAVNTVFTSLFNC